MFHLDHIMVRGSNFIPSEGVNENRNNWVGASDAFHENFEWKSQHTPSQYNTQNEWAMGYESKSSSNDGSSTQNLTSPQVPPRPQRPFTEYNVFFQLERELLLQNASDDLEKNETAQKILSYGKEIESPDVAALRPPQYRHLALSVDWYVVGNKYKSSSTKSSDSVPSTFAPSKRSASAKKKENHGKISFLELTKLISSKWREVDPVTKEFCKKIAAGEAERYKKELEEYKLRYGVEAAKGKKRKPRKSLSSEAQKKTKQGNDEREEIDMLNNFVPIEGDLEEDDLLASQSYSIRQQVPLTVSDLGGSSHMRMLYARQQEIQAQLMQYRQRRTASPPLSSSFTVNTFQGIPKDFSQSQTFQGSIITPHAPFANRYAKGRQILQNGLRRLHNDACTMSWNAGQSFFRQNSAFDSKYDFLDSVDGGMDDHKVHEFLRDYERKVFRLVSHEDTSNCRMGGIDRNLYLRKFHRKCVKKQRLFQSEVSRFDFVNNHNHSEMMNFPSNSAFVSAPKPKLKKLRSLQSNDWALFTEHVEIKGDDDI